MSCSQCGAEVGATDKFCASCGSPVAARPPGSAAPDDAAAGASSRPRGGVAPSPQYGLSPEQYGQAAPQAPGPASEAPEPPPPRWPGSEVPPHAPPPPPYPPTASFRFHDPLTGVPTADWWQRAVALIIDWAIFALPWTGLVVWSVTTASVGRGLAYPIGLLAYGVYYVLLNGGTRGQTVGKMAVGIATRDESGQGAIGYGRALARLAIIVVCYAFCVIPEILNYLWPLWDSRRQAWHDKAARSLVVNVR